MDVPRELKGPSKANATTNSKVGRPSRRRARCRAASNEALQSQRDGDRVNVKEREWTFQGHKIRYVEALAQDISNTKTDDAPPALILVHGFGGAANHWREALQALPAAGFDCYSIDLLGLGMSDKPIGAPLSIELWRDQVIEFRDEVLRDRRVVAVGNSLGSLTILAAAAEGAFDGLILHNCAGGLNSKEVAMNSPDWRLKLAYPIFLFIDVLLSIRPLASYIFDNVRKPESVRKALSNVYLDSSRVDEELIDIVCTPATTPNALDAFVRIFTGPPGGQDPQTLASSLSSDFPLLVIWGTEDIVTPLDGPLGSWFRGLDGYRDGLTFVEVEAGHCPFDDAVDEVNDAMLRFLRKHHDSA